MRGKIIILFLWAFCFLSIGQAQATDPLGRILLQVEENGEAWYVYPKDYKRYFLGSPDRAYHLMRELGQGISNDDLLKIPLAVESIHGFDADGDFLPDVLENSYGSDPNNKDTDKDGFDDYTEVIYGYSPIDPTARKITNIGFANSQKGMIFLQVEKNGEAWYVNPENSLRYFLGRPRDAQSVMSRTGLGVQNDFLNNLPVGEFVK